MSASRFLLIALLLMPGSQFTPDARADGAPTKDLLQLKDNLPQRMTLSGPVTAVPSQDPTAPGLLFTASPAKRGLPEINLAPAGARSWDLSAFGHVEARVVNTGTAAARFVLRVDNEGDWRKAPWNTSQIDLSPGERGTVKVVFGYQFNQKGYPLDPKRIVSILMYTDSVDAPTSFRIESLVAGGRTGETQYVEPPPVRIGGQAGAQARAGDKLDPKRWKLVWADEFNYTGLPDPAKWSYEEGYIRNKEPQYYTRAHKENAWVAGGVLTITARRERSFTPPRGHGADGRTEARYTSASLNTRGKASWTYGRIEMRARLPRGRGTWPALWTVGTNGPWPAAGEIDILEYWASDPHVVHSNIHFALGGKHSGAGGRAELDNPWDDFHVYDVEWNFRRMDFYCDRVKYYTFDLARADENGSNPFRKPQFLILNLALVGGNGAIDDSSLPQKLIVDYVRVYQPVGTRK